MGLEDKKGFRLERKASMERFLEELARCAEDERQTRALIHFRTLLSWLEQIGVPIYKAKGSMSDPRNGPEPALYLHTGTSCEFSIQSGSLELAWSVHGLGAESYKSMLPNPPVKTQVSDYPQAACCLYLPIADPSEEVDYLVIVVSSLDDGRWFADELQDDEDNNRIFPRKARELFSPGILSEDLAKARLKAMWDYYQHNPDLD
jgi:hypothetical protein